MPTQTEVSSTMEGNYYDIEYVVNVITKEAPKEKRLTKQVLYTLFSAKSNDPLNLAINAPTGEGKTYVVQKVVDLFPKNDVICLVGMSEKALFHRPGTLVVKNDDGNYISIEQKIKDIESHIQDCETETANSTDKNLKQAKRHEIKDLEDQKKEIYENSKKLIELSGKTLIFLDSPPAHLLEALMPLLSHDRSEVDYEFVDTYNGIKTHGNVLRGFPAVIFTAARDYTNSPRYPEIQRRFLITNPQMSQEKYHKAIECITAKYSLPDYAYQQEIVSDQEKDRTKNIIINIQNKIADTCSHSIKRDHNQVFIPYYKPLESSLPFSDASYMTAAKTLFTWISLLATIHQRPQINAMNGIYVQQIPLATFDDLKEAMSLIEHNNGVRSYILKWYNDVFLSAYESKTEPDSKEMRNSNLLTENRIAVTSRDLMEKTAEVEDKKLGSKSILETYINPLINLNVISSEPSVLDRRANIYYPVKSKNQNKNLFDFANSNNISESFRIRIENSVIFPNEIYIMHEIDRVLNYSSDKRDKLVDHNAIERSVQEIVSRYYNNSDECFITNGRSVVCHNSIRYDFLVSDHISREYYYNHQNDIQLQTSCRLYEKNLPIKAERAIELFVQSESNNFLYPNDDESQSGQANHVKTYDNKDLDSGGSAVSPSLIDHHNANSQMSETNQSLSNSNSQLRKAVSTSVHNATTPTTTNLSHVSNLSRSPQTTVAAVTQFFYDEPFLPYHPPSPHELEDSPCKSIIRLDNHSLLYNCTLHPDIRSYHLESIEHHIKYKNPEMHKSEILKLLEARI